MAFEEDPQPPLAQDVQILQALQNANHVVNLKALSDDPEPTPEPKTFKPSTTHMNEDENQRPDRFPNRLLIRLFLCAARACAAMAWPPGLNRDTWGYMRPEEARDDIEPLLASHGAIRPSHWLFGGLDHRPEHSLVPIMKLISFDEAYVHDGTEATINDTPKFDRKAQIVRRTAPKGLSNPATRANVHSIGVRMGNIILEDNWLQADEVREEMGARDQWARNTHPGYDPQLIELVARCIAVDPNNRPSIYELLDTLKEWSFKKTAEYYSGKQGAEIETDEALRELVKQYIFDVAVVG
ncbi:kinase-like domain-containing protein [Apiospora phragmitis]|uniref:Kinase-like domain-containing protein n=1 Tax=Apiospora phragmitis TaxID=2905665 RepID=A0ABR1WTG9_9PEZI